MRCGAGVESLDLLFWDGRTTTKGARVRHDGRVYEAAHCRPGLWRAMTLPVGTATYGSTRELSAAICAAVRQYAGLDGRLTVLISRFVLCSWLIGSGPTALRLSILGRETTGGLQLMQLLRCICRRPLILTDVDRAAFRSLPMEWHPTLLIQQPQLDTRLERLLNSARRRDVNVPQGGRLLDLHCTVATYTQFPCVRAVGGFVGIEVPVHPATCNLAILNQSVEKKIAGLFQPQLLRYRLMNYQKASCSAFDVAEFKSPMQETARCMTACTPDDRDLQDEVLQLLKQPGIDHPVDRWTDPNCAVIEAVLARCHLGQSDSVYVGQIAHDVEVILTGRGENFHVNARDVGERLRMLGLFTEPRDSKGFRLALTAEVRGRIHELARDFSVPTLDGGAERCGDCRTPSGRL
jgi:hypothetical protein